jgi:hypothetical protein
MRTPPTGELCAGEPHAQFGGRGGATLSDPYQPLIHWPFYPDNTILAEFSGSFA